MSVSIEGIWSTRAGDYSPAKHILTRTNDYRYFFRLNQDAKDITVKKLIKILIDGKPEITIHDWMSVDGREDNYFDIPLAFRTPGRHSVQFEVYKPASSRADSKEGELEYTSDKFTVEYQS